MKITPAQVRAARALLNWNQSDLANYSGITATTINNIENSQHRMNSQTQEKIISTLSKFGIVLLGSEGVSIGNSTITKYTDQDGILYFLDNVFMKKIALHQPAIRMIGFDAIKLSQYLGNKYMDGLYTRLNGLKSLSFRLISYEAQPKIQLAKSECKLLTTEYYTDSMTMVFMDNVVHFTWNPLGLILIENSEIAANQAKIFDFLWQSLKK